MRIIATVFLTLSLLAGSYSVMNHKNQQPVKKYDYATAWNKVQDFEYKGLPESALSVVNEIYTSARAENNAQQLVKAVIYRMKFTDYKEEDSFVKNLASLDDELKSAEFPVRPLLHSMLAEAYWIYYQHNRYRFDERSQTIDFNNDDIATWSLEKIVHETIKNYQLSLEDADRSKSTKIDVYDEILINSNTKGRAYRPTLYDFLAHRAVDFYMGEEPALIQPAYVFTINSADYLKDAESFCKLEIVTKDTLAYKYYALKIFQDLIRFHLDDKDRDALVDVDLKRLQFVSNHLTLTNKSDLYLEALEQLEQKTMNYPVSTRVTRQMAEVWREKGGQYNPLQSDDHKEDLKKAYALCETAIKRFPGSDGAAMAWNLQQEILRKSISVTIEKVNVPGLPFRALVAYKNFTSLHWRIIEVTRDEVKAERKRWRNNYDVNQEEKFLLHFVTRPALKTGTITLPDDGDFQEHKVEVKLDASPSGDYMVLFSPDPGFLLSENMVAYAFTTLSDLSYIHRNLDDGSTELYVLNRTTGEPVTGAGIKAYSRVYNGKTGNYERVESASLVSDADGCCRIPYLRKNNRYYSDLAIEITAGTDKISTADIDEYYEGGQISQYPYRKDNPRTQTVFFLDRSIYRPGQTLYFKGLVYLSDGKNPQIIPDKRFTVTFYDVNYQVVAKQDVTTNEYGTFNGTFTTPSSGLTGQMHLQMNDNQGSNVYFSVEEYKRPKFEVNFESVKGSFRLGEIVQTTGHAKAYSGANIDGASVKYRVVREARFPFWWWCWYGYYPVSPAMEITNGSTETDAEGKFTIDFKAIPDESVDRKSEPAFTFRVYADVTDINGETHSGQTSVSIGYKALVLGVTIESIDKNNEEARKQKFPIITNNLAGEFEPSEGTIKIWKLRSPVKAFRERMWPRPDRSVMTRDEYYRNFPHDLYEEENNFYKWEKEKETYNLKYNTSKAKDFSIPNLASWDPGKYLLEITGTDRFEQAVREVVYFDVFDSRGKSIIYPAVHRYTPLKTTCEPGEKAVIMAVSSEKVNALYEIEQDGRIIERQRLLLNNEKHLIELPVKEEYRGNITVHYTVVKDSRLYKETTVIHVPYTNKQLDIQFESFRDKLQPGQEEQWKIKISGNKADKVMAEMVASLYDASLDVFRPHGWYAAFYHYLCGRLVWNSRNGFEQASFRNYENNWNVFDLKEYESPAYDDLNWFGMNFYNYYGGGILFKEAAAPGIMMEREAAFKSTDQADMEAADEIVEVEKKLEQVVSQPGIAEPVKSDMGDVQIRRNFNETAFFYPALMTDENGEVILNFTIPEALTRWKMLGFAHTKELAYGSILEEVVTQKDLMVVPNQPRFFRENDKMIFSAKVTSLVDDALAGQAQLEFFDALTMRSVDALMKNTGNIRDFTVEAKQSTVLEWSIEIPEGIQAITYRIVARAGNFSDGEEMMLPVVTNRMLVTETLPLPVRGKQTKIFRLDKLVDNTSTTLRNHRFTLEFTSNPAWYAVQALPYMMEYPYECTEQVFSRYYANSIASHIANSNPKIKRVFDTWATIQPDALLSNLEKNQELKSALLEETPWVLNAKDESQRKRNVALLFDLNRMANEQERALKKILEAQLGNGGFTWFPGFPDDRYITQHITAGLGHLDVMGVQSVRDENRTWQMVKKALGYMDREMQDHYEYLKAQAKKGYLKLEENHLDYIEIHYLYTRSYFRDIAIAVQHKEGFEYFMGQAKKYWLQNDIYMQGMMALALHRFGNSEIPAAIIRSLNERALHNEEMGMYWKTGRGYFWYQAPIETQALMVEVYDEVAGDRKAVEDLKTWLLKQKQTQDWKTTKATSEACYALLRRGTDVLATDTLAEIMVGNEKIDPFKRQDSNVEAGTGYFKTAWTAVEITPEMGNIRVSKKDEGVAWGAVYWQYFEQLDKITPAETPLKIVKQLFLQQYTDHGPVIKPVNSTTGLHVGDLVKVRIELRVDRTMEYVHLKDMRAAGFEPVETLSSYKFQDGLYYYQSPRDLAVNFFFGYLPKGTYVFEYPLRVSQKGDFSNGITTIQCMYAPEFSSHSEGIRVKVE
ncbi:MAG: hypothetical protein JW973_12165 [Bacteroidales bacterium]|nr:hypothetical protein [Bacteroidales bacterium]